MKPLNPAKPTALLIIGIPGAGKSFFAQQFSQTFGAPVVSHDRILSDISPLVNDTKRQPNIVKNLAYYQIEELCKTQKSFIIDGGCNAKSDRIKISELTKPAGYETLVIWVQTHESTALARATKRSPRREGDKYNTSLTPEQFATQTRRLTPPNRENYVVISGMHTYSTQAKAVLRKIVSQREREAEAEKAHKSETQAINNTLRPRPQRRNLVIR